MLKRRGPSLNGVRAAVLAARHGSLASAAQELGVSPSAVSHQVRKLEDELGAALFERHANFLRPTEAGRSFFDRAGEAIALIDEAAFELHRDADEIRVQASSSFAVRWLIPALGRLNGKHPRMRVQVETVVKGEPPRGWWDVSIDYRRRDETGVGERLVCDRVLPLVSPELSALADDRTHQDLRAIPALRCTSDDWDWTLWCRLQGLEPDGIIIGHAFDTDDAAIRGALAGMGMVLGSLLLVEIEIRDGTLVPVPGFEPVELGRYEMRVRDRERRVVRQFCGWLADEMRKDDSSVVSRPS